MEVEMQIPCYCLSIKDPILYFLLCPILVKFFFYFIFTVPNIELPLFMQRQLL